MPFLAHISPTGQIFFLIYMEIKYMAYAKWPSSGQLFQTAGILPDKLNGCLSNGAFGPKWFEKELRSWDAVIFFMKVNDPEGHQMCMSE